MTSYICHLLCHTICYFKHLRRYEEFCLNCIQIRTELIILQSFYLCIRLGIIENHELPPCLGDENRRNANQCNLQVCGVWTECSRYHPLIVWRVRFPLFTHFLIKDDVNILIFLSKNWNKIGMKTSSRGMFTAKL